MACDVTRFCAVVLIRRISTAAPLNLHRNDAREHQVDGAFRGLFASRLHGQFEGSPTPVSITKPPPSGAAETPSAKTALKTCRGRRCYSRGGCGVLIRVLSIVSRRLRRSRHQGGLYAQRKGRVAHKCMASTRTACFSGQMSPPAKKNFQALGWIVHEKTPRPTRPKKRPTPPGSPLLRRRDASPFARPPQLEPPRLSPMLA